MVHRPIDWAALDADPRFGELRRKKAGFLGVLMAVSIGYYFMLPIGAAWFPEFFRRRVFGAVNIGLLFALSEFVLAWAVAALYTWRANREFDRLAAELNREVMARHPLARRP